MKLSNKQILETIHQLDQLYCRTEALYNYTLDPETLLDSDPTEVLSDLKDRLPKIKKLLKTLNKIYYAKEK